MIGVFDFAMLRDKRGDELEAKVDAAITQVARHESGNTVEVVTRQFPDDVVVSIADEYREKGWRVEIEGELMRLVKP